VFIGDTIHVVTDVIEARRSRSRPGTGIVTFEHHGINQRDEMVCLAVRAAMMHCRPEPERG
jgi:acyl dehydratase